MHTEPEHQAANVLAAFVSFGGWVRRRVESLHFVDDATVRRRVSLDFMVDQALPVLRDYEDGTRLYLVPLTDLEKAPLTNFDVVDGDGRPLPMLTSTENGAVAGLLAMAKHVTHCLHPRQVLDGAVPDRCCKARVVDRAPIEERSEVEVLVGIAVGHGVDRVPPRLSRHEVRHHVRSPHT